MNSAGESREEGESVEENIEMKSEVHGHPTLPFYSLDNAALPARAEKCSSSQA